MFYSWWSTTGTLMDCFTLFNNNSYITIVVSVFLNSHFYATNILCPYKGNMNIVLVCSFVGMLGYWKFWDGTESVTLNEKMWYCQRKNVTRNGLWSFKSPLHSQLAAPNISFPIYVWINRLLVNACVLAAMLPTMMVSESTTIYISEI